MQFMSMFCWARFQLSDRAEGSEAVVVVKFVLAIDHAVSFRHVRLETVEHAYGGWTRRDLPYVRTILCWSDNQNHMDIFN